RRGVGGIALHADGGVVVSGRDIVHVRNGENRTLYSIDGVPGWNDICADSTGRVYAGSIRFAVFDPDAAPVPGELWRIDGEGDADGVTADNSEVPARRGTIFRVTAGVGGAPVHPARI